MKFRAIFILLMFLPISADATNGNIEPLTAVRQDSTIINYYLIENSPDLPSHELILILQGSDCNSVLHIESIFRDYRYVRPEADILLIEKYGIDKTLAFSPNVERKDCPAQYLKNDNPKQRILDIKTVLNTVRKKRKYSKVIVLGGSEGAVMANLLSSEIDYIDATISFNGGGRWFIDDILHSIASGSKNIEESKKNIENFKGFSDLILKNEPFDMVMSGHGYSWWRGMLSLDQLAVLQKVKSPLLIVQGGADLSVSPKQVDDMVARLRESGKINIEYICYKNLDHRFKNSEGQNELKKVIADMNRWLESKLNKSPKKK